MYPSFRQCSCPTSQPRRKSNACCRHWGRIGGVTEMTGFPLPPANDVHRSDGLPRFCMLSLHIGLVYRISNVVISWVSHDYSCEFDCCCDGGIRAPMNSWPLSGFPPRLAGVRHRPARRFAVQRRRNGKHDGLRPPRSGAVRSWPASAAGANSFWLAARLWLMIQAHGSMPARRRSFCRLAASSTGVVSAKVAIGILVCLGSCSRIIGVV